MYNAVTTSCGKGIYRALRFAKRSQVYNRGDIFLISCSTCFDGNTVPYTNSMNLRGCVH